jgi:hypothetical protein
LFHYDQGDHGPTVIARMTDSDPQSPNAYHLLQPTLCCNGKRGIVCIQRQGTLTIFLGSEILHNSSINEQGSNTEYPSFGVGCVQKKKMLSVSKNRSDVLNEIISFPILENYTKL